MTRQTATQCPACRRFTGPASKSGELPADLASAQRRIVDLEQKNATLRDVVKRQTEHAIRLAETWDMPQRKRA